MNIGLINNIERFSGVVKGAVSNPKSLQYTLERLFGKKNKWGLRSVYQQTEQIDGRDSVIQRFLKFMIGLKVDRFQDYEYLKFEIDLFLNGVEVVGFPPPPQNPLLEALAQVEIGIKKVRSLLKK